MLRSFRRIQFAVTLGMALSLAPAAVAQAASRPAVTTGGVAKLTPSSASLLGKVNPSGAATTYLFQYGTTTLYGAVTASVPVGSATATVNVVADIAALAPATTYHYRLVAMNSLGTTKGADRTFRTKNQPLGLTLAATPNPVNVGKPTVLGGTLTGTGNDNRQVVLQSNPFPYTQGFVTTTNVQLTNATGGFSFPLLSVPFNTQYRVLIPTKPEIVSPIVLVGAAPKISTSTTATRIRRGQRVRFRGAVSPAQGGERIAIQKLKGTRWVTVAGTSTSRASSTSARYSKLIRMSRGGTYRVFVAFADGRYVSTSGRSVKIRLR